MNYPFFSIIIPTFNQCNLLKKALQSVFKQNFKSYEIIVIDNHSTDNTYKVIKSFKKKIIYSKIKNFGSIGKSRNIGIKKSHGKWLAFLDSDDTWSDNKLQKIYKIINNNKAQVICHAEWILRNDKIKKLLTYGPYQKNFYQLLLKNGNRLSTSATTIEKNFLYKKKVFFDEQKKFITAEDYSFFMNLARNGANFYFTNEPLGYHLFHKKSNSHNLRRHLNSIEEVIKNHIFNIQDFSENKKLLWLQIKNFLDFKNSIFNLKNISKVKQSKDIISFLIKRPFFTINQINNLLLKKTKDCLLYIFYKLKFLIFFS